MKRNLDLIRRLLFLIQDFPPMIDSNYNYKIVCDGYDKQTIDYHLYLMKKEELIDGIIHRSIINKKISVNYETLELTSNGHDLLATKKGGSVWGSK